MNVKHGEFFFLRYSIWVWCFFLVLDNRLKKLEFFGLTSAADDYFVLLPYRRLSTGWVDFSACRIINSILYNGCSSSSSVLL